LTGDYRFGKNPITMDKRPLTELTEYRFSFTPPLSLSAVARDLDVSPAAVQRWEIGERNPNRKNLKKIAGLIRKPEAQIAGYAA